MDNLGTKPLDRRKVLMLTNLLAFFKSIEGQKEEGQGLIEYALIVLLIAIGVIVVLGLLGGQVQAVFQNIANALNVGG